MVSSNNLYWPNLNPAKAFVVSTFIEIPVTLCKIINFQKDSLERLKMDSPVVEKFKG